jgi:FSR family fosmidomycin resistance protein-like MFS transporter
MDGHRFSPYASLAVLAGTHALVDACCATLVFSLLHIYPLSAAVYLRMVVGYNILAFALQPLCGWLTDRFRAPRAGALLGILFTGAALVALLRDPWVTTIFAGLGNALYHIGGGSAALTMRPGRAAPSGYFVAPGALGLAAGAALGGRGVPVLWPFAILLCVAAICVGKSVFPDSGQMRRRTFEVHENGGTVIVPLLLVSVTLRSFTGCAAGSVWQGNRPVLCGLVVAAACGKALGGLLSDRLGWRWTGVGALLLSALFYLLGADTAVFALGGMLLFQMTMPVTLAALYSMFPGRPGGTFGLCCLALIVGTTPAFFPFGNSLSLHRFLLPAVFISAVTLFAGLRLLSDGRSNRLRKKNEGLFETVS